MYWFVTKAIYSAGHISMLHHPNGPFYLPFFLLLCSLYVMHCYWFWFILLLVYKVVTGNEIEDNRDLDDESIDDKKKNWSGDNDKIANFDHYLNIILLA